MKYVFKSKALQAQQAKQAERAQQATTLFNQISSQFLKVKQRVEELWGERGVNRAVRVSDLSTLKDLSPNPGGDDGSARLYSDVELIKEALKKIANSKGAAE